MNSEWTPKYLHRVGHHASWLDHRLLPEVGAMLAAMMSRVPKGGILARYVEVVEKIAKSEHPTLPLEESERHLTEYSEGKLHPIIQGFFDKFVGEYGHASIKELVSQPVVFIEHISWWAAYLSFDNPLVRGQEMSTRAVWRRDWPMAGDASSDNRVVEMHRLGLEIAWHETEAWKKELNSLCTNCDGYQGLHMPVCGICNGTGRKYPWIDDPQAFRPAFDRARWALPGTIETGVSHAADVRTMGRVLKVMEGLAASSEQESAQIIIEEVKEAYRQALPGMAGMWLKEAVHSGGSTEADRLPGNVTFPIIDNMKHAYAREGDDTEVKIHFLKDDADFLEANVRKRLNRKEYADDYFNSFARVDATIRCSLAASRDWHRHRTAMPWQLRVARYGLAMSDGTFVGHGMLRLDHHYAPISEFGKDNVDRYMSLCTELHDKYMAEGNQWMAMLSLPLGTRIEMKGQLGLKDAIYMLELRALTEGANFEYMGQASNMLNELTERLGGRSHELLTALGLGGDQ